jgi:hypothetical protein
MLSYNKKSEKWQEIFRRIYGSLKEFDTITIYTKQQTSGLLKLCCLWKREILWECGETSLDLDKNHGIEQKLNEDMMNGHTRYKLIGGVSDETELILRRLPTVACGMFVGPVRELFPATAWSKQNKNWPRYFLKIKLFLESF